MNMDLLEKNAEFTAEFTGLTTEGLGVCRIGGRAVFAKGALPGETWRIRIVKSTGAAVYARALECLSPSPDRVEPGCGVFGQCGGCELLHLSYAGELREKLARVNDALRRIGGTDAAASEIIGSDAREGYRNKAIYAVGSRGGKTVYGFYRTGTHEIVPAERCLLQSPEADALAGAVCRWMDAHGIAPYDRESGRGAVRHIFTRTARGGAAVCCVVSARGFGAATDTLAPALLEVCPKLTGVALCINKRGGNTVLDGDFHTLWGDDTLTDTLCGFEFRIGVRAFYQINPPQAERLYERAVSLALPERGATVLELYCGAGTISLCLARRAERVIGAEIVPQAVENAAENARRNGIENAEFICADAGEAAAELARRGLRPDAVVVDPPRKGMDARAVEAVASMAPERIVYVSCDPATLARDVARFAPLGYAPELVTAVDMFPRTCHVETVVLLTRRKL